MEEHKASQKSRSKISGKYFIEGDLRLNEAQARESLRLCAEVIAEPSRTSPLYLQVVEVLAYCYRDCAEARRMIIGELGSGITEHLRKFIESKGEEFYIKLSGESIGFGFEGKDDDFFDGGFDDRHYIQSLVGLGSLFSTELDKLFSAPQTDDLKAVERAEQEVRLTLPQDMLPKFQEAWDAGDLDELKEKYGIVSLRGPGFSGTLPEVESLAPPSAGIEDVEEQLTTALQPIRDQLQSVLSGMEGKAFNSVEANRETAQRIQRLCRQMNLKIRCPVTGLAGDLRFREAGGAKHGIFSIDVRVDGKKTSKTNSTKLPVLQLISDSSKNS